MSDPKNTIRDALSAAEELPSAAPANDPPPVRPRDDLEKEAGRPHFYNFELNGCPIKPLGLDAGNFYFVDSLGHFQEVEVAKLGRTKMLQMVGDSRWLWANFPSYNKEGDKTGWKINLFSECLIDACVRAGSFDPAGRVRGAGVWQDKDGQIVVHCGDARYVGRHPEKPGVHDGYVYPARGALPRPDFTGSTGPSVGRELFEILQTWNWQRGDQDVKFLMGWIVCAFMGAAAPWRPMMWISGDAGTGKSGLQSLLHELFGGWLLQAADASRAGLFQTLHYDCLPVALDELEPDIDPRKGQEIIGLARLASSGAALLRGGQDGKAMGFQARSAFLFSSINIPPLKAADKSRMAICELGPLQQKTSLGDLSRFRQVGARILARVIMEWPRFLSTFNAYRQQLQERGHSARAADQFGALGAGYDLLTRDGYDPSAPAAWAAGLPPMQLTETAEYTSDAMNCLSRLLTSSPPVFRGGKTETIAYWMREARKLKSSLAEVDEDNDAVRILASCGIRVDREDCFETVPLSERPWYIAICNSHEGTGKLFEGSHWQAVPGAPGVWVQALKRIAGANGGRMWIDGKTHRCVVLPWEEVFQQQRGPGIVVDKMLPARGDDYEPGQDG